MATLLGDATLQSTTSITEDSLLVTNRSDVLQQTEFRTPVAMLAVEPSTVFRDGSFLAMAGETEIEYLDPEYVEEDTFIPQEPISYGTNIGNGFILQTDKFIFDFGEINELAGTSIAEIQIILNVTTNSLNNTSSPFASTTTADIFPSSTNFGGRSLGNWSTPDGHTIEVGKTQEFKYITTDQSYLGTTHSGTFQPFFCTFQATKLGKITINSCKMKVKYTGKTLLKTDFVVNDSITYIQKNSSGTEIPIGSTAGQNKQLGGTDVMTFNWDAGTITDPGINYRLSALQVTEYITLIRGGGHSISIPYHPSLEDSLLGPSGNYIQVESAFYTANQNGSDKGDILSRDVRKWQADVSDLQVGTGTQAGQRGERDAIARPNGLVDYSVSNLNEAVDTALKLSVPYHSADTSGFGLGNDQYNAASEFEFRSSLVRSPTGNTGYKDTHGTEAFSPPFTRTTDTIGEYRSIPYPKNTKLFLRMLYAPVLNGASSLDTTSEWNITGLLGIKHGISASDIGTPTTTFTQDGQGGFLIEAGVDAMAVTSTATFTGGLQRAGASAQASAFTKSINEDGIRLAIKGEASLTATMSITIDEDLFKGNLTTTKSSTFEFTFGRLGVKHGMAPTDLSVLASSMAVTVVSSVVPGPSAARTFVLPTFETRTLSVPTQTRTNIVAQQTRTATAVAQNRTVSVKTQGKSIPITVWSDPVKWSDMTTWTTETEARVLTIRGYDG